MNKLSRCYTALGRLRKSKGFGIHSPFAFRFVLRVLREKYQYYAYEPITEACHIEKAKNHKSGTSISLGKLLFRVTNFFKPKTILAFGNIELAEGLSLMSYSMSVNMTIVGEAADYPEIFKGTSFPKRVKTVAESGTAIAEYFENVDLPYIYVEKAPGNLSAELIDRLVQDKYVVIVKNMHKVKANYDFWEELLSHIDRSEKGMSFTNDKVGICYFCNKLPLQHFRLWL